MMPCSHSHRTKTGGLVSTPVVQHQEETQGRHVLTDTRGEMCALLPASPTSALLLWAPFSWRRKQREKLDPFLLKSTLQDGLGTGGDAFDADLAARRMTQGEPFGRPIFGLFVGLLARFSFRLPLLTRRGDDLRGACFLWGPNGQPFLFGERVCPLDQVFCPAASGSVTSTGPLLRTRMALPGSHQVRSRGHVSPASCQTHPMVCLRT